MDCKICGENEELVEHHVSYSDRYGMFPIEIILEVCMPCHRRIHKEEGFYDKLNPVELPPESHAEYEELVFGLIQDCDDIDLSMSDDADKKYRMYRGDEDWKIEPMHC